VSHVLVTNDFPPKLGGIQSYLWELWRRVSPPPAAVLTTPHPRSPTFDGNQSLRIRRAEPPFLLPTPSTRRRVLRLVHETGAEAVVLDPAVPLGIVGPTLGLPYAVVLHGAEVTIPARFPGIHQVLATVISRASLVIAAGSYPESEARRAVGPGRMPPVVQVPPGVDTERFRPLGDAERQQARGRLGLPVTGPLVVSVSRLVPRKGMDTLIAASDRLAPFHPGLTVAIAGAGRDRRRLERLARRSGADVRLLGTVADTDLPDLYACGDVFAMSCRSRWGGLEQEGFGIVFLEAAASGVASVAGDSGGAAEAVADGKTGLVVRRPSDAHELAAAVGRLLAEPALARRQGLAARQRAEREFSYDVLVRRLEPALAALGATRPPGGPRLARQGSAWSAPRRPAR
jgi:phosphatidyl-myo-inositol dimannoside synthase